MPLSYRDSGGGEQGILFIHGTGHNLKVWEPLSVFLCQRFHVVAFDMRGHEQTAEGRGQER